MLITNPGFKTEKNGKKLGKSAIFGPKKHILELFSANWLRKNDCYGSKEPPNKYLKIC